MKPLKRNYRVNWFILVTTLLLLGGLAAAQSPSSKAWGRAVDGLQMRISLDQAEGAQSKSPKFRIELRNAGEKDLLLNLGIMTRNGGQQYTTAVSLILGDADGKPQLLELKRPIQASDAEKEALYLPLPVAATLSFPVHLEDYVALTSKEFYAPKLGTCTLAAQFNRMPFPPTASTFQTPSLVGLEPQPGVVRVFDMVNAEAGGSPTTNTLQFEVPTR
jgi:hypothetical protein